MKQNTLRKRVLMTVLYLRTRRFVPAIEFRSLDRKMSSFTDYPDLISAGNGGQVLFATDDFFAVCENMILDCEPIWNPSTYTPEGKEMDGRVL